MKKAKGMLNRIWAIVQRDEMRILPGQLAFFMVLSILSIFPLLGLLSTNFISTELIAGIEKNLPQAVYTILESLMNVESPGSIILFAIFAIYIASDGCGSMIIASNVIYKVENSNYFKQKIKAIIMTILLISLIIFIVVVPAFGELIINTIAKHYPGRLIDTIKVGYSILEYPLSFVLIFIDIKLLYTLAPDVKIPSYYNNYGTLFTTVLWIIVTRVYAIYLNNFNTYNIFYGSLSNVVILLFWIYLLAYVFTMGMAINSNYYFESQKSVN